MLFLLSIYLFDILFFVLHIYIVIIFYLFYMYYIYYLFLYYIHTIYNLYIYIYIYAWETQREGGETGRSTSEIGDAKQEPQFGEATVTHQEAHNGNTQRETKETVLRISS